MLPIYQGLAKRTYIIVTILFTVSALLFSFFYLTEKRDLLNREQQILMLTIAAELEQKIDNEAFNNEALQLNSLPISQEEKALWLNKRLQPLLTEVANKYPGYGVGIYSKQLERVVAIGPIFDPAMLVPVTRPEYTAVYQTGMPTFTRVNNSVGFYGKPILNLNYPIVYNHQIIGHTWASRKTEDADPAILTTMFELAAAFCMLWLLIIITLQVIFRRFDQALAALASQIANQDDSRSSFRQFPQLLPILDTIISLRNSLKKENTKLHHILESINDIFIAVDGHWQVTYVNPKALQLKGIDRDCIGKSIWDIFPEAAASRLGQEAQKVMSTRTSSHFEHPGLYSDRWYEITIQPASDGIQLYGQDITIKKETQRNMARLEELNVVSKMASSISHEVRNPMTTVRGMAQLLSRKPGCEPYQDLFALIVEELDRANTIISDFLSVAKVKADKKEPASLNSIIRSLHPLIAADGLKNGMTVKLALAEDIPLLPLNGSQIRQLLLNLARNAFEAMSKGGTLTIQTYRDNQFAVLAVADNGPGIDISIRDKLGTAFITTKQGGTGLGVTVCYSIAEQHNATINIATGPEGTTFYIRFPVTV